jgi:hypothetical protein
MVGARPRRLLGIAAVVAFALGTSLPEARGGTVATFYVHADVPVRLQVAFSPFGRRSNRIVTRRTAERISRGDREVFQCSLFLVPTSSKVSLGSRSKSWGEQGYVIVKAAGAPSSIPKY